jgi:predicted phosphoribosyltransferase
MNSFLDRREAGRLLAARLSEYARRSDAIVLALPRGGMPVAYEVARALELPLDVFLVRDVFEPGRDDVQIGTITSGGYEVLDAVTIAARGVDRRIAEREMSRARQDLAYQERVYRGVRPLIDVNGRTVLLIQDGIAAAGSVAVAVDALRRRGAARIVVAAPVAAPNAIEAIRQIADACVSIVAPDPFYRIGVWYDDFAPVSDASLLILLDSAARHLSTAAAA